MSRVRKTLTFLSVLGALALPGTALAQEPAGEAPSATPPQPVGETPSGTQHEVQHAAEHGEAPVAGAAHAEQSAVHGGNAQGEQGGHRSAAGEHGAAGHGEHAEHHIEAINWADFSPPPRPNPEGEGTHPAPKPFLATVINFLILLTILYVAVKRVVNPALASRRAAVEAEMGEAQRLRAEAEAMHREYSERLAGLEKEIAAIRSEFVQAGERERDRIIAEARDKAERMRRDAEIVIQQELKQLRNDLVREAVEAAALSAEQAIRTSVTSADQARLADNYLAELERVPAAKGAVS